MGPKKKIMVVEDNWLNREMLASILEEDYTVLEAENGQQALELLAQHREDMALILLDVMMPVMDGYTFLDRIKQDETLSLIPVIVTTQGDTEADEVEALAHGATDFVPKPYRPRVIQHRVASLIKLREDAAMANQFKYDRLTGLFSKEYFYQKVLERLNSDPQGEYSIVCSNIENFKMYNDGYGLEAGDRLLKHLAEKIQAHTGPDGLCGRFGADRFLMLKERSRELQDRELFLRDELEGRRCIHENVVLKWGVYPITDRSVPVQQMCDRAFLASGSIRGQYNRQLAVYDERLRDQLLREKVITESMETALAEHQFTVYFQPKYSLKTNTLAGAEALVRWIHPKWGFMSPGDFIPLFEKNGFITQLDRYVWEQTCVALSRWQKLGYPPLAVSVNVSRADIYQADLPQTLSGLIRKYGLKPEQLHLELTESAYTENPNQILATVDQLRGLGFLVEMDDFGSGYSSLNMLNQMKLDILKLDMKFIQTETAKPADQGILRFIISLARWLNLSVVAEGVETREQLERLRDVGCDYVQGYYFAKPMPAQQFEELLEANASRVVSPSELRRGGAPSPALLVVDADSAYRERVCQSFEKQFRVLEAEDAESALDILRREGPEGVRVMVLSTTLPEGGTETIQAVLRRDPILWRVPVVAALPGGVVTEETVMKLDADDFLCKCHPMYDLHRRVNRLLSLAVYRERAQALEDEAYRDFLTGLLNRRGLYSAMDALHPEDLPMALYMFDLDDLKSVNDQGGHEVGDEALKAMAELLHRHTRNGDVLCRCGGDEFTVILRRIASPSTILEKGRSICRDMKNTVLSDGQSLSCTGGVVLCGAQQKPSVQLLERADEALRRAKQENRGSCCLWEE